MLFGRGGGGFKLQPSHNPSFFSQSTLRPKPIQTPTGPRQGGPRVGFLLGSSRGPTRRLQEIAKKRRILCGNHTKPSWQRWARDPKQVVLDPAGENLHDIFLDPLELNSVETESPWQAGITESNGREFKMVSKKMLESTQPKDKREYEECIGATASARNVLLRTHGFSPYQHVFGRDPELNFDVLVPGADMAAVTIPVLDRPQ